MGSSLDHARSCVTTANFSLGLNGVWEAYQPWQNDWTAKSFGYQCQDCDETANLFYNDSLWIISSLTYYLTGSGEKWYFCEEKALQNCTREKWVYDYDGNERFHDDDATIVDHQIWDFENTLWGASGYDPDVDDSCTLTSTRLYPQENRRIHCVGDPCTITCDEPYGCKNANISANNSHSVDIQCTADDACDGMVISINNVTEINILCSGLYACASAVISINESSFVNINCSEYGSCFEVSYAIAAEHVHIVGDDGTSRFV